MNQQLITSDPAIMIGKPVITGTRITVESILDRFAAGETLDHMLEAHPRLTREAIFAAFALKATWVSAAITTHGTEMVGAFTVISPGSIRIRKRT